MRNIWLTLKVFFIFMLIFGIGYPAVVTLLSNYLMPHKANGSLIEKGGVIVGSQLIGQQFTLPKYFHSRPGVGIDQEVDVAGSHWFPSSMDLANAVDNKVWQVRGDYGLANNKSIIADMVLVSASGLDPHISTENALLQASRVAKHRNLSLEKIKRLIERCTDKDFVGIWGSSGVNVLRLNLALDSLE